MWINYTTYDMRREKDSLNPTYACKHYGSFTGKRAWCTSLLVCLHNWHIPHPCLTWEFPWPNPNQVPVCLLVWSWPQSHKLFWLENVLITESWICSQWPRCWIFSNWISRSCAGHLGCPPHSKLHGRPYRWPSPTITCVSWTWRGFGLVMLLCEHISFPSHFLWPTH